MADKKFLGIFGKKDKDKLQEELDKAKQEAEAAKKAAKDLMDKNIHDKQEKAAADAKALEADKKIAELESKLNALTVEKDREKMIEERQKVMEERKAKLEASKKPSIITTHKVQPDETLSHIALKYYKHATPPYWKFLLEHNTELLEGNERNLRTGMELEIPELPEDLKD